MKSLVIVANEPFWNVAPFAGAWIEMLLLDLLAVLLLSLPSRERGLKSSAVPCYSMCHKVAPFAGAWIEIPVKLTLKKQGIPGRSLRGSVD